MATILLVTYNHECYIREAVRSAISQECDFNYELVVSDDCSTDATVKLIKEATAGIEVPVNILDSPSRLGISKNYKRGFAASRGQFVSILRR